MKNKTLKPQQDIKSDLQELTRLTFKGLLAQLGYIIPIPGIGGTANIGFDILFPSPALKRLDKWIRLIEEKIFDIDEKHENNLEKLLKEEAFISLLYQIIPTVVKTHQQEKFEYLRNAFLNAFFSEFTFDFKSLLLQQLDDLTPSHIVIMTFLMEEEEEEEEEERLKKNNKYDILFDNFKAKEHEINKLHS